MDIKTKPSVAEVREALRACKDVAAYDWRGWSDEDLSLAVTHIIKRISRLFGTNDQRLALTEYIRRMEEKGESDA